jgi:hypothetical protein
MASQRVRDDVRSAIAAHAARLMIQDGIDDRGLAKRKAARQLGYDQARHMPDNDELDFALREYQSIYQPEVHAERLRQLRALAVEWMLALDGFHPYLTGSVLSGNAGPNAAVHIQLFAENPKSVEMYLLNQGLSFEQGQVRLVVATEVRTLPIYTLNDDGATIVLAVLADRDVRSPVRATPGGKIIERAKRQAVEALLAE